MASWMQTHLKKELHKHTFTFVKEPLSKANAYKSNKADIVVVFIYSKVNQEILCEAPNVKMIATTSSGYNHIDQDIIKSLTVCNVPSYGATTVAEHTFALMLSITRKLALATKQAHKKNVSHSQLTGTDLFGKTLGIIGTGAIGSHVARIAHCFGIKLLGYDIKKNTELTKKYRLTYVSFKKLLQTSDIISLHTPLLPSTKHLINTQTIQYIKPGALLINTARGELIETKALWQALNKKTLAGAGLDVLEEECIFNKKEIALHKKDLQLCSKKTIAYQEKIMMLDNVTITPHNGFNTQEALTRILETTVKNINAFLDKKTINRV
jgi:D-lactate dehydrogenase